jgi:hypothetical protein
VRPPPSLQVSNSPGYPRICPAERGLFESAHVSVSVSTRRKSGFYPSVSASKNSVPDSDVRDRFDDWVGGLAYHPVLPNRRIPGRVEMGRFCGGSAGIVPHFRSLQRPLRSLRPILASRLRIQKFRSPQWGLQPPRPLGIREYWEPLGQRTLLCMVRNYRGFNLRASNCRLQSAGVSRSRSTPMPRGKRPAAFGSFVM